ncbi:MAG: hypothetical protein KJ607_01110 [Bacteroidetes bacterium]|nr:hypothetical protein [Bacteroidota bacterium]
MPVKSWHYDREGNVTDEITYTGLPDRSISEGQRTVYNNRGKVEERIYYNSKQPYGLKKLVYRYEKDTLLTKRETYALTMKGMVAEISAESAEQVEFPDIEEQLVSIDKYTYDENRKLTEIVFMRDTVVANRITFVRNEKGMIEQELYGTNPDALYEYKVKYDEQGKIAEETEPYGYINRNTYNEHGQLTGTEYFNSDGNSYKAATYTYIDEGESIEIKISGNGFVKVVKHKYNEHSLVTETEETVYGKTSIQVFTYISW